MPSQCRCCCSSGLVVEQDTLRPSDEELDAEASAWEQHVEAENRAYYESLADNQ